MAAKNESAPDRELETDIKSFAAKIGFAVPGETFEHDEFAADRAGEPVTQDSAKKPAGKPEGKPSKRGPPEKNKNSKGKKKKGGKDGQGVQPRQESKTFRSLLGPEEPAVWFEAADQLPKLHDDDEADNDDDVTDEQIEKKKSTAEAQLKRERVAFERKMKQDYRDSAYLQKVKIGGTSADRIAALTLLIRESALANVHELEPLLNFMEKRSGSRELVARSMEALSELFKMYLLPERKLMFFEQQPVHLLSDDEEGAKHALYWFVEDLVKRAYGRFIAALETATCDPLDFLRERSTSIASHLLGEKPEQEARLLTMVVNRLGDRLKKISSKVVLYISLLLQKHPNWKEVITREVERFTLMPNNSMRVVHYATAALNQMRFNSRNETDKVVARRLVDLYFTLFKMILNGHIGFRIDMERKAEMKGKGKKFHKKKFLKKLGKRKHRNGASENDKDSDPPPRIEEMDARILNNLIIGVRRAIVFVPWEERDRLVEEHLNNLFKIVHLAPIGVGIQALTLLFQVLAERSTSGDRLYRALYARLIAPSLLGSSKLPLMVSTLFRAMKGDPSMARMAAFAKRLLQIGIPGQAETGAGFLLLLSELMKTHRGLKTTISQPEEDEDVEKFEDAIVDEDGEEKHPSKAEGGNGAKDNVTSKKYKIGEREPLYCNADGACLWELATFASHVHPTVSEMARSLLALRPVEFIGDPLQDLGLVAFLDKFYGKEARSHAEGSVFRPMGGVTQSVIMKRVGSAAFGNQEEEEVGKEDLFFHKYYTMKSVKGHRKDMSDKRRNRRGSKRSREEEEMGGRRDEEVLTDDDDDGDDGDLEELEADMSDGDVEKLVGSKEKKSNASSETSEDDVEYNYDDLGAAMEAERLSDSDGGVDELVDDSPEDSDLDDEGEEDDDDEDDVVLPSAEFPAEWSEGEEMRPPSKKSKTKASADKKNGQNEKSDKAKKKRRKGGNVFAPAEEYAHMIED
ncbi:hypothetical protein BSKO_01331 [Bryopsis sp. KO-2023]|nr:hypothetical protein BSKO_01331 [Bryopsis sp. KO-2023]